MNTQQGLSPHLQSFFDYEISRGNEIRRVDQPAGTQCPLAFIFVHPLDIQGYLVNHEFHEEIDIWENRDSHYPLEKGVSCGKTRHIIAGPIK